MSGRERRWQRRVQARAPLRACACGCGRRLRSWQEVAYVRGHAPSITALLERARGPESARAIARAGAGKCAVCGGPYPDGSGCPHCPAADDPEGGTAA